MLCRSCDHQWEEAPASDGPPRCPACGGRRVLDHPRLMELGVAHIDCDAFYAAIHKRNDPALRERPVIVGGGQRGVVTTACYIARTTGVRSAMPMFKALKLCPDAVVIKPQFELYSAEGRKVRAFLENLTPLVEPVSIDEAYLDLTGTERLHGAAPAVLLSRLQRQIEAQLGLTVSVGLSSNKFLAKTASDLDKPRGFAVLAPEDVPKVLWPRPVGFLHGVGPAFAGALEKAGYRTVSDLAHAPPGALEARFGDGGARLARLANGVDTRPVDPGSDRKSIGAETTFNTDLSEREALDRHLQELAAKVGRRARAAGLAGRVVVLKLKTARFRTLTRRVGLPEPTATGHVVLEAARQLLGPVLKEAPFRLIGVSLMELASIETADQGDLVNTAAPRRAALERALDTVVQRFGAGAIRPGSS